jgi:hypothetical protein
MAQVKILEMFEAKFQAQPEMNFKDDDDKDVHIDAAEAREATIIVGETPEGYRIPLELPDGFKEKISVGDSLDLQCSGFRHLERYWRVKHVRRIMKADNRKAV